MNDFCFTVPTQQSCWFVWHSIPGRICYRQKTSQYCGDIIIVYPVYLMESTAIWPNSPTLTDYLLCPSCYKITYACIIISGVHWLVPLRGHNSDRRLTCISFYLDHIISVLWSFGCFRTAVLRTMMFAYMLEEILTDLLWALHKHYNTYWLTFRTATKDNYYNLLTANNFLMWFFGI